MDYKLPLLIIFYINKHNLIKTLICFKFNNKGFYGKVFALVADIVRKLAKKI
ncbi:hypothetical protein LCGC14_1071360 [marine sediment metagenome]|uniref:Uncharacterized protein n=1 Tax=marine sediment metagenome TaxID=412755 RepID=A0A0F9N5B7_9ZZZZ